MDREVELVRKVLTRTGNDKSSASIVVDIAENGHTYAVVWSRGNGDLANQVISRWSRFHNMPIGTVQGFRNVIAEAP